MKKIWNADIAARPENDEVILETINTLLKGDSGFQVKRIVHKFPNNENDHVVWRFIVRYDKNKNLESYESLVWLLNDIDIEKRAVRHTPIQSSYEFH